MVMMGMGGCVLHSTLAQSLRPQLPDPETDLWACVAEGEWVSRWACTGNERESGGKTYGR